jgi:hypothetical protein
MNQDGKFFDLNIKARAEKKSGLIFIPITGKRG